MADIIEVPFTSNGKSRRAVVVVTERVRGVLTMTPDEGKDFADKRGIRFEAGPAKLPKEVRLKEKKKDPQTGVESDEFITAKEGEAGPGVCYWVEEGPEKTLVCW